MRWINTEPVIQSEVSQKEKNKYHILTDTHIYIYMGSRKMVLLSLSSGEQWRHRHRGQTYGHRQWGGKLQGRMNGESSMETHTLPYVRQITKGNLLYDSGNPGGSDGKVSACNIGDPGSIPGFGRSRGEGHGNPLQHSCLENSIHRGAWWTTVHGVTKSWT